MKPRRTWIAFALSVAVLLAVMAWTSAAAVDADRRQRDAEARAAHEEQVRLALWRMDSRLTPLIAREAGRTHAEYDRGEIVVDDDEVLLYFVSSVDGGPRVIAASTRADRASFVAEFSHADLVAALGASTPGERGALTSPDAEVPRAVNEAADPEPGATNQVAQAAQPPPTKQAKSRHLPQVQQELNLTEWDKRVDNYRNTISKYSSSGGGRESSAGESAGGPGASTSPPGPFIGGARDGRGTMQAVWVGERLLLGRWVAGGGQTIEGCWLDWPRIEAHLRGDIEDLLDAPTFERVEGGQTGAAERLLATLPIRLDAGPALPSDAEAGAALEVSLAVAWSCMLAAATAVFLLLRASVGLSERRGAFVSAVTHELRTPLTTFRIYTEMLAEGMIEDADKRQRYLETLRREADRLGILVENVLAYAKIEGEVPRSRRQSIEVLAFVHGIEERLRDRSDQGGLDLHIEVAAKVRGARMLVDPGATEQILFNLVDNAAKYASGAGDRRLHLEADAIGRKIVLRVRDHGPGIPRGEQRRIFAAFSKSSRDESGQTPGVGLGLALSRRLARQMGGELRVAESSGATGEGACFELVVPSPPTTT